MSDRKCRSSTAVVVLAVCISVGGCSSISSLSDIQPSQPSQSSSSALPQNSIFDWLDSQRSDKSWREVGANPTSSASGPKQPEIYLDDSFEQRLNTANAGPGFIPANFARNGLINDARASVNQRVQTNLPLINQTPSQGVTSTRNNSLSINFEGADIKTVGQAILGDIFSFNYSIDPRVTGTISLVTRRPVTRQQLLPILEDALRAAGAVLVQRNGVYHILPERESTGTGAVNVGEAGEPGYGITVLPLENLSADAVLKLLDGFGARPGSARVDQGRNLLVLQGTQGERERLVETAQAFDVDWMRHQAVGIFPVQNSNPDVVISELNKMVDPNVVRFQQIGRMNAILAITKNPQQLRRVASWISRLDRISDTGVRVRVFSLKHADARRVTAIIREMFTAGGSGPLLGAASSTDIEVAPGGSVSARVAAAPAAALGQTAAFGQSSPPAAATPPGDAATANDTTIDPTGPFGARIRVTADLANNSVVVYSGQQEAKLIERAIRDLDRGTVQVAIEATIAEVQLNDSLRNGVQFYLRNKKSEGSISNLLDVLPISKVVPGLNFVLGSEAAPKVVIDALRDVTDVKILSSPSLVVVNNQTAVLQVGDQVPITTRSAQAVISPDAPVVNSIEFRDTGVILRVTPRVYANSLIGIEVEQEISSVKDPGVTGPNLTPTISTRKVKSTVSVADRQTLLLAGLISEQRNFGKKGIPGVIDIPVLGNLLASNHSNSSQRTELIIFIKPQLVRNMVDAQDVAEELRLRLKGFERW